MVLEKLGDSLKGTLQKITKSLFVDEKLINELVKDLQKALLQADVNVRLVFQLTESIKKRIKEEEPPTGLSKKEQLVNIVYEELVKFLGEDSKKLDTEHKPTFVMLVGLFGSGKTTMAGKLGHYYSNRGKRVAAIGLDVYRPAAMEQLEQNAKRANIPAFINREEKDPRKIFEGFKEQLQEFDIVIVDTAGRDALSDDLISEITDLNNMIKPQEKLLVISADIGQTAEAQAKAFVESCGITGVVATKMDGTAKAGGALSACAIAKAPIVFIGVGEHINDIEPFNPKGFVSRLLGMGDIEALLDKAKEAMDEDQAQDLGQKFLKGDFTLLDLYEQMQAMKKMGPLNKVMEMIPGMGNLKVPKEMLDVQQEKLGHWKHAMDSMTKTELEEPDDIDMHRIERISKGSGVSHTDVRGLLKQFRQTKKMMKMFKGKGATDQKSMEKMMKRMGGMKGMKF